MSFGYPNQLPGSEKRFQEFTYELAVCPAQIPHALYLSCFCCRRLTAYGVPERTITISEHHIRPIAAEPDWRKQRRMWALIR